MKKITILSLLAIVMTFASCSSDDEPRNPAAEIAGTYRGYTEAGCAYFTGDMTDNETIVVTTNTDNTCKVVYNSETWGEFVVEKAAVVYSNDKYTISGNGTTEMGMGGNLKEYACTIEGEIDSEKKNPTFTFNVPTVMGGLKIEFKSGEMPAADK